VEAEKEAAIFITESVIQVHNTTEVLRQMRGVTESFCLKKVMSNICFTTFCIL